jgi:hypothetical protein
MNICARESSGEIMSSQPTFSESEHLAGCSKINSTRFDLAHNGIIEHSRAMTNAPKMY